MLFFFFFYKTKRGAGRPYVTYPPRRDLIGAPPLGNVGLSHSYCDRDATDLTLAPQESQSVGAMQAMKIPPPTWYPSRLEQGSMSLYIGIYKCVSILSKSYTKVHTLSKASFIRRVFQKRKKN